MAGIDFSTTSTPLNDGVLQLQNGVAMDSTLRNVADQLNTTSPLKLSNAGVQVTSTLQITTNSNPYIDAEDGAGNNRFQVGRDPSSQVVNVDFASNPTGGTNMVGAIRTYTDGVNLASILQFRKDGTIFGIGTQAANNLVIQQSNDVSNFYVYNSATWGLLTTPPNGLSNTTFNGRIIGTHGGAGNSALGLGTIVADTSGSNFNLSIGQASTITTSQNSTAIGRNTTITGLSNATAIGYGAIAGANYAVAIGDSTALLQIGGNFTPTARTHIRGTGSTSATTSLLVQNSSGTTQFSVGDSGTINGVNNKLEIVNSGNQLIIRNPALGNYFYIGPSNVCGVDSSFSTPTLIAGNLTINGGSSYQGSVMTLSNFIGSNTGTNYGLRINSQYTNNGAGGPNYGKQVSFYDNLNPNNIQLDMTFAYVYPTINYQGTSQGAVVGYDFNPTITAVTANTKIRAFQCSTGGVYINTTSYDASACLQADSTTQGFLPPRMTDAQIRAIVAPTNGLVAYNTDINHLCCYQAGAWVKFSHTPM